jgi:putative peptide zinc metalloprotease protein
MLYGGKHGSATASAGSALPREVNGAGSAGAGAAVAGAAGPHLTPEVEPRGRHAAPGPAAGAYVPRLAAGAELLGQYEGSGLTEATYLARTPRGQVVHLSRLLYLVLSGIDGSRTADEIATRVTAAFGRTVSAGNVEYLLAKKLAPLGLVGGGAHRGRTGGQAQAPAILALRFHRTLVPAPAVQHLARLFAPLFSPLSVVAVLASLVASDVWLVRGGQLEPALRAIVLNPVLMLLVLGLAVASMLFHECGHAAACRYGGARPGRIGMGIYVAWPAFFTNVTDSYRLGRAGRIRTDLGGVYFNSIFVILLAVLYLTTGYLPLLAAILVIHLEIAGQLLPSLRFDGYFILTDLVGVPDLFQRIGPTLRSMIPGRPTDPKVASLKRGARASLTAWVLVVVPLFTAELLLIIAAIPSTARTVGQSVHAEADAIVAQFGRVDIPAGLLSVISLVLLVVPVVGLSFVLLLTGRSFLRLAIAANRRHPALRFPSVAVALLAAGALAAYWGLLPLPGHASPRSPAASQAGVQRTAPGAGAAGPVRPARRAGLTARILTPVSAHGFDPLASPGSDPGDENNAEAQYAIDANPATAWQTQYYLGSPYLAGLKAGTGLILDMGRPVRLSSVTITFGAAPGADVAIEVGNDNALAPATLPTFTTVASADGIGGTYTFTTSSPAAGRYVLIWFTKLPPAGAGRFQAEIFNIVVRGSG